MDHRERIADFVARFPGRDDDEISRALQIRPRQTVNQICRALAATGVVVRRPNPNGKLGNYLLGNNLEVWARSPQQKEQRHPAGFLDATLEWFWEGNVTNAVSNYLREEGWAIISQADTSTKERGVDIHATRLREELMIEVKGYPSRGYRDPNRNGEKKPTNPSLQAQHWYAHALLKALRMQSANPTTLVAVAFPDFPRYRALFDEIASPLRRLGIVTLFVAETGQVEAIGL